MANIRPTYVPWLFDSREAFNKTVNDPRYRYDMPFNSFLNLYKSYRNGSQLNTSDGLSIEVSQPFQSSIPKSPKPASPAPSNNEHSQILSQEEIDALIAQANAA